MNLFFIILILVCGAVLLLAIAAFVKSRQADTLREQFHYEIVTLLLAMLFCALLVITALAGNLNILEP